jgi:hypothetical protein
MDRFTHWPLRAMAEWSYVDAIRTPRQWIRNGEQLDTDAPRIVIDLTDSQVSEPEEQRQLV